MNRRIVSEICTDIFLQDNRLRNKLEKERLFYQPLITLEPHDTEKII